MSTVLSTNAYRPNKRPPLHPGRDTAELKASWNENSLIPGTSSVGRTERFAELYGIEMRMNVGR